MKRIFLIIVSVCGFCVPSYAIQFELPLEDAVQTSDLIVIGTLDGLYEHTANGIDYGQGSILIDEVIWGAAYPGDSLNLKWENGSNIVCPRVEHRHNQGIRGIWLLTIEDGGVVGADHPDRFVALGERANVERFLHKNKVLLRIAEYSVEVDEPVNVSVVFRNPTQSPIEFPGLEYNNGRLVVSPGIALTFYDSRLVVSPGIAQTCCDVERTKLTPLPNRVLCSQNVASIIVGPRQEVRVTVDMKSLFKVESGQSYGVRINVKGHRRANDVGFYSGPLPSLTHEDTLQNKDTLPPITPGSRSELPLSLSLVFAGLCFLAYRHRRR